MIIRHTSLFRIITFIVHYSVGDYDGPGLANRQTGETARLVIRKETVYDCSNVPYTLGGKEVTVGKRLSYKPRFLVTDRRVAVESCM